MPAGTNTLIDWSVLPEVRAELGESPVWDEAGQCLWWVDIDSRFLFRTGFPSLKTDSWPMPERPGFVTLTSRNRPAIGMETGIYLFDPASTDLERIVELNEPGMRFNDATVDAFGRLWTGTMDLELKAGRGILYAIGTGRALEPVLDGLHIPNGLAFDEERIRLYVSDSGNDIRTVWTFDVETGSAHLGRKDVLAVFSHADGKPDGAVLDRPGNYWIAAPQGGALRVYSPDGKTVEVYSTPFGNPTKPAFGGASLDRLFVTSRLGSQSGGRLAMAASTQAVPFCGRPTQPWRIDP